MLTSAAGGSIVPDHILVEFAVMETHLFESLPAFLGQLPLHFQVIPVWLYLRLQIPSLLP